jgi:RNA polymerase-interacting CarD/CdnL/TRCF family regulator
MKEETKGYLIRLTEDDRKELERLSKQSRVTMSKIVRDLIRQERDKEALRAKERERLKAIRKELKNRLRNLEEKIEEIE